MALPSLYVLDMQDREQKYYAIVNGVDSMTKITEEQVNKAFDAYLDAFNLLAEQEDVLEDMQIDLDGFKEGTARYIEAQEKLKSFERGMAEFQRNLRKAALELDRIKTLVSVQRGNHD